MAAIISAKVSGVRWVLCTDSDVYSLHREQCPVSRRGAFSFLLRLDIPDRTDHTEFSLENVYHKSVLWKKKLKAASWSGG